MGLPLMGLPSRSHLDADDADATSGSIVQLQAIQQFLLTAGLGGVTAPDLGHNQLQDRALLEEADILQMPAGKPAGILWP